MPQMRPSDLFIFVGSILFFGTGAFLLAWFRRSWSDVAIVGGILMLNASMFNRWFAPWPAVVLGALMAFITAGTLWSGLRSRAA